MLVALGKEGQVIIDLIPELELVVGKQPNVPLLGPQEAQNRFNFTFQSLVSVFAKAGHPLVIFLDDLQWADSATLHLLIQMLPNSDRRSLLFVGAYRNNEVDEYHAFSRACREILGQGATVQTLELAPLDSVALSEMISDVVGCSVDQVSQLSHLTMDKTQGNPFFVNQFLKRLFQDHLIIFNSRIGRWLWDIGEIEKRDITSNVVELMIEKIRQLPAGTQKAINLGACIGNTFELMTLALACQEPLYRLVRLLWPALELGLLVASGDNHKLLKIMEEGDDASWINQRLHFHHDRIQQAAYEIVDQQGRELNHSTIGQLLLASLSEQALEDKLFSVVGQLNDGARLIFTEEQRVELARLNVRAGKKARSATAYGPALTYFCSARELLPELMWGDCYELTFDLYIAMAECKYLEGDLQGAEIDFDEALKNAKSKYDECDVYVQKLVLFFTQNKYVESIEMGLEALRLFELDLSVEPQDSDIAEAVVAVKKAQGTRSFSEVLSFPKSSNHDGAVIMRILIELGPSAYMAKPKLLLVMVSKMVEMTFQQGLYEESSFGFGGYSLVLSGVLSDLEAAYQTGEVSLELIQYYGGTRLEGRVQMLFTAFTSHWKEPIRSIFPLLKRGYDNCLALGELRFACYIHLFSFWQRLEALDDLAQLKDEYVAALHFIENIKDDDAIGQAKIMLASINSLACEGGGPLLVYEDFVEHDYSSMLEKKQYIYGLCSFHITKLVMCFTYGDFQQAWLHAQCAEDTLECCLGLYSLAEHSHYTYLTLAQLILDAEGEEKLVMQEIMSAKLAVMRFWSDHAPENYLHKLNMMEAEEARLKGDVLGCLSFYEKAAHNAEVSGYTKDRALNEELCAGFWLQQGKPGYAEVHYREARNLYNYWGAVGKVKSMDVMLPNLADSSTYSNGQSETVSFDQNQTSSTVLDIMAVMKAAQSISGNIVYDELASNLVDVVIESAGAQKGVLVLKRFDDLVIEAVSCVDDFRVDMNSMSLDSKAANQLLPVEVILYVARTGEDVAFDNAEECVQFSGSEYLTRVKPKSLLCIPISFRDGVSGVIYLENRIAEGVFSKERRLVLEALASQAAISLENARLYRELFDSNNLLEQRVEERTAQLEDLNEELSAFSHTVSHDLRAPLRGMQGLSSILLEDYSDKLDAEGQHLLHEITRASQRMTSLINGLLALSKLQHQQLEVEGVSLSTLAMEIDSSLRLQFPDQQVQFSYSDNVMVRGDERMLFSLLENLLSNAWKYSRNRDVAEVEFGRQQIDDRAVYFLKDNGAGFNMDYADKLFVAFQRLHIESDFPGLGIGLATVKRIVERHKGKVWADGVVGVGATIYFTLGEDV